MIPSITNATDLPMPSTEAVNMRVPSDDTVVLCPREKEHAAQLAINLIHGKWKMEILCKLEHGANRLSQFRRSMPRASKRMLTMHLRQLEKDHLIVRTDLSRKLRHVEYSLSKSHGVATLQLIDMLAAWGKAHVARQQSTGLNSE
jgi:DNA-binding HxlR family transcriptional regulator